jgi:ketosteroid isomerase-like protein
LVGGIGLASVHRGVLTRPGKSSFSETMKPPFHPLLVAFVAFSLQSSPAEPSNNNSAPPASPGVEVKQARLAELDAYWAAVSRAVNTGDFDAYAATCHSEGVLVSGSKQTSQPLADALARWKQEFLDTRDGKMKASVEFRFSSRIGDATTAHETGVFLYSTRKGDGAPKAEHVHFEALLVKQADGWKILMEYQKSPATEAEWQALK